MQTSKSILATTVVAGALAMQGTVSEAQSGPYVNASSDEVVRPFQFHAAQADLDDLHRRILATKWPEKETVSDQTQGVQLATMKALAKYWANDYDWRKAEDR